MKKTKAKQKTKEEWQAKVKKLYAKELKKASACPRKKVKKTCQIKPKEACPCSKWNSFERSIPKESGFYWLFKPENKFGPEELRIARFNSNDLMEKMAALHFNMTRLYTHWQRISEPEKPKLDKKRVK